MLTLKLKNTKTGRMRIIECGSVDVDAEGENYWITPRNSDKEEKYFVGVGREYDIAFVETSRGATTQAIRPGIRI